MNKKDKQILQIKQIYPMTKNISIPVTLGLVHDVYIVENEDNQKFICRFSNKETAEHNVYISKLLTKYNINVPQISFYKIDDTYCETYPFIEGKTLHDRLIEGIPEEQQNKIYEQMFHINYKISEIPYEENYVIPGLPVAVTTKIVNKIFGFINRSKTVLCHTDLQAKNILLDKEDNISAIIDLDSVYPESLMFAIFIASNNANMIYGYNVDNIQKLCDKYNANDSMISINNQIKIYQTFRKIYRFLFTDCMRKQILKIRLK